MKGHVTPCQTLEECEAVDNLLWVQVVRNNTDTNVQASSSTPELNETTYLAYSDYRRVGDLKDMMILNLIGLSLT